MDCLYRKQDTAQIGLDVANAMTTKLVMRQLWPSALALLQTALAANWQTSASLQMVNLYCMGCRGKGKEEDSRWLSGTYLLVHPASKHLGSARVRVKVLLELKPQSSGRANARHWQVPQVEPSVIQTDSLSPVQAAHVGLKLDGTPSRLSPARSAPTEVNTGAVIASTQPGQAAFDMAAVQAVGGISRGGRNKADAEMESPGTFKADAANSPSAEPFTGGLQFASAGTSSTATSPSREDAQTGACLSSDKTATHKQQAVTEVQLCSVTRKYAQLVNMPSMGMDVH